MKLSAAQNMVLGQVYTNEVNDPRILQTMAATKRELFVPPALREAAYTDADLNVGNGRSLLAPMTFARLLTLANITPECRVLDIGCLNGYSTAVLSKLASHIVAVDTDADNITRARELLKDAKNVNLQNVKSLADGYGMSAPYDVILINGAINFLPNVIAQQLSERGRLVTVFRKDNGPALVHGTGKGLVITRLDGALQSREYFDAATEILTGFKRESGFTL
jgi:protein-L-isoaspartate(D-aspartate) O-methyltransferase